GFYQTSLNAQSAEDTERNCKYCHNNKDLKRSSDGSSVYVNPYTLRKSVHKKNRCQTCHKNVTDEHESGNVKLRKVRCSQCHKEARTFNTSDHGKMIGKFTAKTKQNLCNPCHSGSNRGHSIISTKDKSSKVYRANIAKTCASCHERKGFSKKYGLLKLHPVKSYENTIHGLSFLAGKPNAPTCIDCHGSHMNQSILHIDSKLAVHNVGKTCGKCHQEQFSDYERSIHGKAANRGYREAPMCITCHGEHNIYATSTKKSIASYTNQADNCAYCHQNQRIGRKFSMNVDRISTYRSSYHGTMNKYGDLTVASCSSCHGSHLVLPSSNKDSYVHKSKLNETCGMCHYNAGMYLSQGTVHVDPSHADSGIVYWIRLIYILVIVGTIGFMLFHNGIDLLKKMKAHYKETVKKAIIPRLNKFERIKHLMLLVGFTGLAWTGFSLSYPEAFFAFPFRIIPDGFVVRWWMHRVFAGMLALSSFLHIIYAIFTRKGRKEVVGFLPKIRDITDCFYMIMYNLGFRKERPLLPRQNYIEKLEYLALVWGTAVMAISGGILLFEKLALRYLPYEAINISKYVHFYEAILATLAIIIWHLYFTIFDPDEYPMNWTFVTGRETKHQHHAMHGDEDVPEEKLLK
ncbi:cytochrome b/b6 domain-containing protein, partial [Spirochaetota bacterium]